MNMELKIKACDINHLEEYGRIYAAAFSGEPWCDPWKEEDAVVHVKELLECPQSYGLECVVGNEVAGFLLGTSMLFHYGRTFEMDKAMTDLKRRGIVGVHLITAADGWLKDFYGKYGFMKEERVILMGMEMDAPGNK